MTTVKICIDGQMIKQPEQFRYVGSLVSEDRYCEKDIRSKIEKTRTAFIDKWRLFTSKLNSKLKKRLNVCVECGTIYSKDMDTDESKCSMAGGF